VVVNIEATVESIQRALEEAELMADCKIRNVYTGIAGSHIRSFNSSGMVAIKDKEVTPTDVARVIETAKAVNIPTDQQLLHTVPQEFIVDNQEDVREPIGMSGIRLEVRVHIVTGAVSAVQNIVKCVRRCGLEVSDLILQPMASADSVLTPTKGTRRGADRHRRRHHRRGGVHRRRDPPHRRDPDRRRPDHQRHRDGLRTPTAGSGRNQAALRRGQAGAGRSGRELEVPGLGDRGPRTLSRQALAAVIEPRVEELFAMVHQVVRESGYEERAVVGHRADRRLRR
jgi:cell division protein FtsA